MHEMALAEGVLQILVDQSREQDFTKVKKVWIEIGELSHVEPDALDFCFDSVVRDTLADGAKLEIIRTPGKAWCHNCGKDVHISSLIEACPDCGGYQLQKTGGDDMRVRELEVE